MPFPGSSRRSRRSPGAQRIFTAADGRVWNVAVADGASGALLFNCISDARERPRAIVADHVREQQLSDVSDEQLCEWLRAAPLLGTLM